MPDPVPQRPPREPGKLYTSPSDVGLFMRQPFAWLCKHFKGMTTEGGPSAWGGVAVEEGIRRIFTPPFTTGTYGIEAAYKEYDKQRPLGWKGDEKKFASIRAGLETTITNAITVIGGDGAFRVKNENYTDLGKSQHMVTNTIGGRYGMIVTVRGYIDFMAPDRYGILELKTGATVPSAPRPHHLRQVAFYRSLIVGTDGAPVPVRLLYASPKKAVLFQPDNDQLLMAQQEMTAAINTMCRLYTFHDIAGYSFEDLVALYPIDFNSFDLDANMRALGRSLVMEA